VRSVEITDRGRETLAEAERTATGVAAGLLAHLDPPKRTQLTALLAEFLQAP
jgi:DNA-binding MarR family transcriptional regulator